MKAPKITKSRSSMNLPINLDLRLNLDRYCWCCRKFRRNSVVIPFVVHSDGQPVALVFRRSTTQPTTDQIKGNIGQYRGVKSSKVIVQDSEHIIVTVL